MTGKVNFMEILFLSISMVCIAVLISCGTSAEKKLEEETAVTVRTEVLARSSMHTYIETDGSVESENSVKVYPDIAGKITESLTDLGSAVKKGDILAYVDPSTPGTKYELSRVTAPIAGSILSVPLPAGSAVTPQTSVTTIGNLSSLCIKSFIPERFVAQLKTGLQADVTLEAYPGITFKASVRRISPVVDELSRTKEIILAFTVPDDRINSGMFADVKLFLQTYADTLSVPDTALVVRNGKTIVYTAEPDNKASEHEVTAGISVDGRTQIVSGLKEGAKVIIEGQAALLNGSIVHEIGSTGVGKK